jgi:hypothetical protein
VQDRSHAVLSASGSYRWMACPPSVKLEAQFPDTKSEFAAEGSFAHELAECRLRARLDKEVPDEAKLHVSEFYNQELSDAVNEYVDYVVRLVQSYSEQAIIQVEERFSFTDYVPEGFGTADFAGIDGSTGVMDIVDLKFGKGVAVSAENNSQLRCYALGVYQNLGWLYDVHTVRMHIVQPRLDSISVDEMTLQELLDWGTNELAPAAARAWNGEGEFKPGDHCRFCRARHQCRARAESALTLAEFDFKKPELLSDEEVSGILLKANQLQAWASDLQSYALSTAEQGKQWPGWKLVEGRSNRRYVNHDAVAKTLVDAGIDEALIYERSLLGITAMEKTLGKKTFGELLKELVIKPQGKPTLVPEADKRPVYSPTATAAADFQ